jgi:hypothetical protein
VIAGAVEQDELPGSLTGRVLGTTSSTSVKIAVFAPIPRAIEMIATPVNSGERASPRNA